MAMRAIVKAEPGPGLSWQSVEDPQPSGDDVVVRIRRTGICGTDLHIWSWDDWARNHIPVPLVIGHEFCGEIVELGRNVRHLHRGQRVSGEGHLFDFHGAETPLSQIHLAQGISCLGINRNGAFAEYLVLPAVNAVALPDAVDDELGAILDPLGNAVHAALAFPLVGENVLIAGAGPIGIMAAAIVRHIGGGRIVLTDVVQERLDLAARLVPDLMTVNVARNDLHEVLEGLGPHQGFRVGMEMSGSASALNQMIDVLAPGGGLACLGLSPAPVSLQWSRVVTKGLVLKGIYGREIFETWRKMLSLLESGLKVGGVVTHRLAAEEFAAAFQAMSEGRTGKVLLDWGARSWTSVS
ncbi:L-threonine 3-dehydrogenase [Myxococcus sp. AB025B]|uniref:L-threonine 3-dehydrogenase n=1 Tax=Myxococcus sp. AB025B TaxID=2562794 RepID=UPI001E504C95|nr:L-threonine 3-dehydrogenase [Myxococcus sp. AB025B]